MGSLKPGCSAPWLCCFILRALLRVEKRESGAAFIEGSQRAEKSETHTLSESILSQWECSLWLYLKSPPIPSNITIINIIISHYLRGRPFLVVSETIVDVLKCTHSIPQCTAKMSVQPMYTQRLENTYNALWESRAEYIPASRQKMAPAAESFIHSTAYYSVIQHRCKWIVNWPLNCLTKVYT